MPDDGAAVPVLYGGCVTSASFAEFIAEPEIDGALVGGASLKADQMSGIVARAGLNAAARTGASVSQDSPRRAAALVLRRPRRTSETATDRRTTRSSRRRCRSGAGCLKMAARPLEASGGAVGLPAGQMGNSEVGHLNLGAGRPVLQDLPRIDAAIADGAFDQTRCCSKPLAKLWPATDCTWSACWARVASTRSTATPSPWPSGP